MRSRLLALTSIACWLFAPGSYAAGDSSADNAAGGTSAESGQAMTAGVVKKVDKAAGKVTLAHGPLASFNMPAMTMAFRVKDAAWLDQMKDGDTLRFTADKVDGAFTIIHFEQAK